MTKKDTYKLIPYNGTEFTMCYAGQHYRVEYGASGLEIVRELGECNPRLCQPGTVRCTDRMTLLEQERFAVPKAALEPEVALVRTWQLTEAPEASHGPNFEVIPHGSVVHTAALRDSYILRPGQAVFVSDDHQWETYHSISNTGTQILNQRISPDEYRTRLSERKAADQVRTLRKVGVPEGKAWQMIQAGTARFPVFLFERPYETGKTRTRALFEAILEFYIRPCNGHRIAEFNRDLRMLRREEDEVPRDYEQRIDVIGLITALALIQTNVIRDDIFDNH